MSIAASLNSRAPGRAPSGAHPAAQGVVLAIIALDVGVLAAGIVATRSDFVEAGWALVVWGVAVAGVGAVSLAFDSGNQLGLDMPILLAAGFLFGPVVGGTIAAVAYVDPREFKGEVSMRRALFNRAQTSLSVIAASAAFAAIAGDGTTWMLVLLGALVAVGLDCVVNYGTVSLVLGLHERISLKSALSLLHFGSPAEFGMTWAAFGLLSLTLVETYESAGMWALAMFAVPLFLARHALVNAGRLSGAKTRLNAQAEALRHASEIQLDERRDERLTLAAGIHDELLPPLFKVHLMSQVLRHDLATGQLLALEDDLPQLVEAANHATESYRALIRSLRASPMGKAGLGSSIRALVDAARNESGLAIELTDMTDAKTSAVGQLLAYQAAREALRNAILHSRADSISVSLTTTAQELVLTVEDDGIGFVPALVDRSKHFGLQLLMERVELAGGTLTIDTTPHRGTRLQVTLPQSQESGP